MAKKAPTTKNKSKAASKAVKSKPASKITNIRKKSTEKVYISHKESYKPDYSSNIKQAQKWFFGLDSKKVIIISLTIAIFFFTYYLVNLYQQNKADQDFYDQLEQQTILELSEINSKKKLIGTKDQLASEIINYQSAPTDLQNWVLKDYFVFKSKCIVNGEYIGPASYEINNVTYDEYAKILMNCAGEDQQIVAKVGGSWAVVAAGKAAPDCNDVNSLAIPMGIAPTCTDGKTLYPNPNP